MWFETLFGHAHTPFRVRQESLCAEKMSQPPPPLQGVIQLRGSVAIARSPNKCHQDQLYNDNEIIAQIKIYVTS